MVLALAVAGPAVLLGGAAWAQTPAPLPSGASWISGGTVLEGTSTTPVTKPVAKPVAKPAAPAQTTTRATTRTTTTHQVTAPATAGAPDGATALPFTGGHVDALLPSGILLVVGGATLTFLARPRRVLA